MKLPRRQFLANSVLAALFAPSYSRASNAVGSLPWRNWSGGLVAYPAGRVSPSSEDELATYMARTSGSVRPVGSGHSFAPLVPTDGHLIVLDQLTGLLSSDKQTLQATFAGGTRLGEIGVMLSNVGQAMFNLPDIDRQTLAGATATATHGTGIKFTCLSEMITDLTLVTPRGEVVAVNAQNNADLFAAAKVSLGALGIVTQITLQNRTPFKLKALNAVERIDAVLDRFDEAALQHRHFEIFPLTHSDYAMTLAIDETDEPINNPPQSPEEAAAYAQAMASWAQVPPQQRQPLVDGLAQQIEPSVVVDESYKILSNIRNTRFNEMEYSVPLEAGAMCLREILATIKNKAVDVLFPLEYRYVRRDSTWMGMSSGEEDHAAISIHRVASEDYQPYFELIEPIFWKYGGRPHWGKIHSLGAQQLRKLYPHFDDFVELQVELDPAGRMLNPHLTKVLRG